MPGFNLTLLNQGRDPKKFGGPSDSIVGGPSHPPEVGRNYRFFIPYFKPLELDKGGSDQRYAAHASNEGLQFYAKSAQRPRVEFDEIIIHSGQDEISRPGKMRYPPIEITFYEIITNQGRDLTAQSFYAWWSQRVADISTSRLRRPGVWTNNPNTGFHFNAQIDKLDGSGNACWSYLLYDCWPVNISPSQMSYDSTDLSEYTVSLRFNKLVEF
jgi:hypothetical protein